MWERKAISFIDNILNKSNLSYDTLMTHLRNQREKWKTEYSALSRLNVFDLTDQQHARKWYLDALINYSLKVLSKKPKLEKTITITGNNLKIKWQAKI